MIEREKYGAERAKMHSRFTRWAARVEELCVVFFVEKLQKARHTHDDSNAFFGIKCWVFSSR